MAEIRKVAVLRMSWLTIAGQLPEFTIFDEVVAKELRRVRGRLTYLLLQARKYVECDEYHDWLADLYATDQWKKFRSLNRSFYFADPTHGPKRIEKRRERAKNSYKARMESPEKRDAQTVAAAKSYTNLKSDPARWEAHLAQARKKYQQLRSDPERWAAYLAKARAKYAAKKGNQ